eukprot:Selendium_serpulae@DN4423_c0_g1_i1.p1
MASDAQFHREVAVWVKVLNQTEGRDKLSKCVQYGSRVISWYLGGKTDVGRRFAALQATVGDSRKIFRLGKFMNEYMRLHGIARAYPKQAQFGGALSRSTEVTGDVLQCLSRGAFLLYWVYDGMTILTKIKFIRFGDPPRLMQRSGLCWFAGLLSGLVLELRKLRQAATAHRQALAALLKTRALHQPAGEGAAAATTGSGNAGWSMLTDSNTPKSSLTRSEVGGASHDAQFDSAEATEVKRYREQKKTILINIIKILGDLLPASHLAQVPQRLTGRALSDGKVGFGGLIAAALTLWQLFPDRAAPAAIAESNWKQDAPTGTLTSDQKRRASGTATGNTAGAATSTVRRGKTESEARGND